MLLGPSIAFAQGAAVRVARVSRPSDEGPSVGVDQVGGAYTRIASPAQAQSQVRFNMQTAGVGPSQRGFGGGMGGGAGGGLYAGPARDPFAGSALGRGGAYFGAKLSPFGMGNVSYASGLEDATSYDAPIGWESSRITSGGLAVYVAPSDATSFHNFFGLTPTRETRPPARPVGEPEVDPMPSELIGRINDRDIRELVEKGKREFALGTTTGRDDRGMRLAAASDYFTSARRLDPKGWQPALLIACVALEQGRDETAYQALEDAVSRNARALSERPDIPALYGTRELFDATVRKYYQIGTHANSESKHVVLEAYFAMLAGDRSRVDSTLRRAEEANRMQANDSLDRICRAMRAAVQ